MHKILYHSFSYVFFQFFQATLILLGMGIFFFLLYTAFKKSGSALSTPAQKKSAITDLQYYFFAVLVITPICYYLTGLLSYRHTNGSWLQSLPFLLQVVLSVYVVDLVFYWQHRLFHTKYLWHFHAVHHSTEHLTWLSNIRSSPVDNIAHTLAIFFIPYVLGFPPEVIATSGLISYFSAYFIHADVPWRYGPLRRVFVSPAHHRRHHARHLRPSNFSGIFAFNDLLFGTYHLPEDRSPYPLGLDDPQYPKSFHTQFLRPWRDFFRAITGADRPAEPSRQLAEGEPGA